MVTSVKVPAAVLEEVCGRAYSSLDEEVCGAIIRGEHITLTNTIPQGHRHNMFALDPEEQLGFWRKWNGEGDLIIYHSHPNGSAFPSGSDMTAILGAPKAFFVIISVHEQKARVFQAVDGEVHELMLVAGS